MVLAAGLATRLRPLSLELPKALMPLGDRPVLAHVLERLARAGLESAVVNSHHLPELLAAFADSYRFISQVTHEPQLLGTAGGVANARRFLGAGPIIVSNADLVLEPPVAALLDAVRSGGVCMAVQRRPIGLGRVGVDTQGQVVRLRGEHFGEEASGADYLSVLALGEDVLAELPDRGCLVADVAMPRLRRGVAIGTVTVADVGFSMGDSVADYLEANQLWLGRQAAASFLGAGAVLAAEVTLESSVVGAGALVDGSGPVTRSVLWPGARARAPLVDVVVTSAGRCVRRDGSLEAG